MKKIIIVLALVFGGTANANADVRFEVVTPLEAVKSVGSFLKDTSKKVCEGATTTVFGVGDIITAPFRSEFYRPKKKIYYYRRPSLIIEYQRGEFYKKK